MLHRRTRPHPTRRIARMALAGLPLAPLGGCALLGGDEAALPVCDVLAMPTPVVPRPVDPDAARPGLPESPDPDPAERPLGIVLPALLEEVNPSYHLVRVYLDPGSDPDERGRLAEVLEQRDGVRSARSIDEDETLDDFRRLFADQPAMVEAVRADDLPTSVEVVVVGRKPATALQVWARRQQGVYEVTAKGVLDGADWVSRAFVGGEDRARWQEIADDLERVEGDPTWARNAAAALRHVLDHGLDAEQDEERALALEQARLDLLEARRGCPV